MRDPSTRTKIICTIGPSSWSEENLLALAQAGMDVCRLNFSHGTHEEYEEIIPRIRRVSAQTGKILTILQDLQGPKIRVGVLPPTGVVLTAGATISVSTNPLAQAPEKIPVTYERLSEEIKSGDKILFADGRISARVERVDGRDVICTVVDGGTLFSHQGMNLPQTDLSVSAFSEKDQADARFGMEHGVDWMALSFVRSAKDIQDLRVWMGASSIPIIAKIEKPDAIKNFDEILAEADAIMVARGDLGVEIAPEKVPVLQKEMAAKCVRAAKPVIIATHMLESMTQEPRPTRAEVSDVANAVIDHADAVMLSEETATGSYPIKAVEVMFATIRETEASVFDDTPPMVDVDMDPEMAATNVGALLAQTRQAKAILVASLSGRAARLVSHFRPELPIFSVVPSWQIAHTVNLCWGVRPFVLEGCATTAELLDASVDFLKKQQALQTGDEVVILAGDPLGQSGHLNLVEIRRIH